MAMPFLMRSPEMVNYSHFIVCRAFPAIFAVNYKLTKTILALHEPFFNDFPLL
jgi:hypothetical protein